MGLYICWFTTPPGVCGYTSWTRRTRNLVTAQYTYILVHSPCYVYTDGVFVWQDCCTLLNYATRTHWPGYTTWGMQYAQSLAILYLLFLSSPPNESAVSSWLVRGLLNRAFSSVCFVFANIVVVSQIANKFHSADSTKCSCTPTHGTRTSLGHRHFDLYRASVAVKMRASSIRFGGRYPHLAPEII